MSPSVTTRTMRRNALLALVVSATAVAGCSADMGPRGHGVRAVSSRLAPFAIPSRDKDDLTLRGARYVPLAVPDAKYGTLEAGGSLRALVGGVRILARPNGSVEASDTRFARSPSQSVEIPARLGGGFLFVDGPSLSRSERWLERATPLLQASVGIANVSFGLDRAYATLQSGGVLPFDPRTGEALELGSWPRAPQVVSFVAADGWRAVAVTDVLGAVATFDAGATWRRLDLPLDPKRVEVDGGNLVVHGPDAHGTETSFAVRPDGQVALALKGRSGPKDPRAGTNADPGRSDTAVHPFGDRPLAAAVEDGWPVGDGTALVVRGGALGRVLLRDGSLLDVARDVVREKSGRCHAVVVPRASSSSGVAFVCGEPRGRTALYAFDAAEFELREVKAWPDARLVLTGGGKGLAVRGACEGRADDGVGADEDRVCVLATSSNTGRGAPGPASFRDLPLRGALRGGRVVPLADGRVAVVTPPKGDREPAHVAIVDRDRVDTHAVVFATDKIELQSLVARGLWMEGFEERRPGVLGGWIAVDDTVIGVEVTFAGEGRVGAFVRDLGSPVVAGRHGIGWTLSRIAYETVDGGMTWTQVEAPDPLVRGDEVPSRAVSPLGATGFGWIRLGWGALREEPKDARPAVVPMMTAEPVRTEFVCEPLRTAPEPVGMDKVVAGSFFHLPAPELRSDDQRLTVDGSEITGRWGRVGPLVQLHAWGPKSGDWDRTGRWTARWLHPFGTIDKVRTAPASGAPWPSESLARRDLGTGSVAPVFWSSVFSDDGGRALLVGHSGQPRRAVVFALEADRNIVTVTRESGESLPDVTGATFLQGRWYVVTKELPGELPAAVVHRVDGAIAREVARMPRSSSERVPPTATLAHTSDGQRLGVVLEGPGPTAATHRLRELWVVPIDPDSGRVAEPESLGPASLASHAPKPSCGASDAGWVTMFGYPGSSRLRTASSNSVSLDGLTARVRVSKDHACIEGLFGNVDVSTGESLRTRAKTRTAPLADGSEASVVLQAARTRIPLACTLH